MRPRRAVAVATALVATAIAVVPTAAGAAAHRRLQRERITFGVTTCAPHWRAPHAGRVRFTVRNTSAHEATVYLFHAQTSAIVATVRHARAHTTRAVTVTLKPGSYAWGCQLRGRPQHASEVEKVSRHGVGGPPVVPVTRDEMLPVLRSYLAYVHARIASLGRRTHALVTAIASGDATSAESAWLRAHRTWLDIGQDDGPYSAFGTLGARIDRTSAGLRAGVRSSRFTGFHRIEHDLWTDDDLDAAGADARRLATAVTALGARPLRDFFPKTAAGLDSLPLRCHEVLEDALRDTLTGDDDYGSGTGLASLTADVRATRELLRLLAPLLKPRAPHLTLRATRSLDDLDQAVRATHRGGTSWTPVSELGRRGRERVDAATDAAVETLAPVPDLLQIGRT